MTCWMPPCWRLREEPVASLTHTEEAVLLGECPEPQEDQVTAPHTPMQLEDVSEPEDAVSLGLMAAAPQNVQRQIPSIPT